jgi:putative transposase
MTVARQVVAGRSHFISRRCTQRQLLLRPDRGVEQIYLYCLGEAAARYEVTLHGFIAMSNHQHLHVRDNRGNFPEFLAHLNKMIAKAMNARLGRWENFWATEQANAVYLVEPADRFAKLVYLLANPVAAHLVDRIADWPGASSLGLHLSGRSLTIERPRSFFSADGTMPAEVTLRIERPDGFEHLSESEWRQKLHDALTEEEERARVERRERGMGVLGRKAVLRAEPTDQPRTVEPRGGLRPHVACLNEARRMVELAALTAFRHARTAALVRALAGDLTVLFPFGTYRIRGFFRTANPPTSALSLSA